MKYVIMTSQGLIISTTSCAKDEEGRKQRIEFDGMVLHKRLSYCTVMMFCMISFSFTSQNILANEKELIPHLSMINIGVIACHNLAEWPF